MAPQEGVGDSEKRSPRRRAVLIALWAGCSRPQLPSRREGWSLQVSQVAAGSEEIRK